MNPTIPRESTWGYGLPLSLGRGGGILAKTDRSALMDQDTEHVDVVVTDMRFSVARPGDSVVFNGRSGRILSVANRPNQVDLAIALDGDPS